MKIAHSILGTIPMSGVTPFCLETANVMACSGNDVCIISRYPLGVKPNSRVNCAVVESFRHFDVHPDVVHCHALWMRFSVDTMYWCVKNAIPFVVSPHGSLMPRVFKKGRLKKWAFWWLCLRPLLMKAHAIHCTSDAEKEACEKLGLKGPFVVAPLGVYMPEQKAKIRGADEPRTVLFLGRLGEEKGLVNLLDAWNALSRAGACEHWQLKIAGPDWLGYKQTLDDKIVAERIQGVTFPGLVQGVAKDWLYRESDVFVLPSPMENFSMVVLDALAYGVPVIATKGTPWSELESEHCGWWIDQGVEPLKAALQEAMSISDDERMKLGANGRHLAGHKYQWTAVAEKLLDCYREVRNELAEIMVV